MSVVKPKRLYIISLDMLYNKRKKDTDSITFCQKMFLTVIVILLLYPFNVFSTSFTIPSNDIPDNELESELPDTISLGKPLDAQAEVVGEGFAVVGDRIHIQDSDTIQVVEPEWVERSVAFVPSPTKAVWLSALFPGLGQVYNRRYWKLPIIVGGYLGLAYATSWNNNMLTDYTKAYADIMDNDPSTKSYMDFFPPSVDESSIDKQWLQNTLLSRKNYFRRNRDLCIICMVGVYLLAMVDAYVDASLSHFDISPDLSMDWAPALIQDGRNRFPSVGLQWAVNF